MSADTQFLTQANNLLNCLCAALAAGPNPPEKCCLTWGDPIADFGQDGNDCCGGAAYVRMLEFYPSSNLFPDRTIERQSGPCGIVAWALRLEMTIFRCWPTDDGIHRIPCEDLTAATEQLFHDARAIREALCCFRAVNRDLLIAVTDSVPIDPAGGCAGIVGTVSIQIPNCDFC
jgi:hypothetical protein